MYTLQNFIEDLPIQGLTILSRPADLSSIPVSSISAQELPLDAFVRENEIVLSTGTTMNFSRFTKISPNGLR